MNTDRQFSKVVDRLIAEENAAYLKDTALQAKDKATGDAWRRLWQAEQAVGTSGVVLPIALAQDVLRALQGQPTMIPSHLLVAMLDGHIVKASTRLDK